MGGDGDFYAHTKKFQPAAGIFLTYLYIIHFFIECFSKILVLFIKQNFIRFLKPDSLSRHDKSEQNTPNSVSGIARK